MIILLIFFSFAATVGGSLLIATAGYVVAKGDVPSNKKAFLAITLCGWAALFCAAALAYGAGRMGL